MISYEKVCRQQVDYTQRETAFLCDVLSGHGDPKRLTVDRFTAKERNGYDGLSD